MNGTPSAISRRAAAVAVAALLVAGVLTLGLGSGRPAVAQAAAGGCTTGAFTYDAAEARRQDAFEARLGQAPSCPPSGSTRRPRTSRPRSTALRTRGSWSSTARASTPRRYARSPTTPSPSRSR